MRRVLLLLGLLLSARSDLRARDPEVEQEDGGPDSTDPKGSNVPRGKVTDRSGNWCAVEQNRVVTAAVVSGTEQYVAKSQSPCPSGVPDCQLVMYKLATRPVYRQAERVVAARLWQCCPGHTGPNCDQTVSSAQLHLTHKGDSEDGPDHRGSEQVEHMDPHQEQNDHQGTPYLTSRPHRPHTMKHYGSSDFIHQRPDHSLQPPPPDRQDHALHQPDHTLHLQGHTPHHPDHTPHLQDHTPHQPGHTPHQPGHTPHQPDHTPHQQGHTPHQPDHTPHQPDHTPHQPDHTPHQPDHTPHQQGHVHGAPTQHHPNLRAPGDRINLVPLQYQDTPAVLPVPHMMALVMSQLQPVLEAFNRSLGLLQSQLGALSLDVAELKSQGSAMSKDGSDDQVEQVYQELKETQDQLQQQRHLLDSHQASLLSDLSRLRTDMNVHVQALNHSLSELKLKQPSSASSSETSALWSAVEQLDDKVVNNTVKVQVLLEDVEVVSGRVQQLHRQQKDQDKRINDTSRRSQVQFMETGLEVEAAKVVVLRRVEELAGNMSLQGQRLAELDVDVDYLYTGFYNQTSSSGDCGCSELRTLVTQLQRGLSNVTELANENRMALDESEEPGDPWPDSDWQLAVEALRHELQQTKWSWMLEENRTRAVERSVADLSWSVQRWEGEVTRLQQTEAQRTQDNQHLRGSFNSLLKDAIRHSDVLELLLGEEVLEFLDWPIHDQEAHSIPALKERLRQHEELLSAHNQSIAWLTEHKTGEIPSADQPSSRSLTWPSGDRGPARERQSLLGPQLRDGSDLWKLEQIVEKLQSRVENLENQNGNGQRDVQLQDEVMWLKRGLEDHLRVFKNIFSNTDKLAASKQPLELDKVFDLVKSRQRRKGGSGSAH